jgi:hypothetical protein
VFGGSTWDGMHGEMLNDFYSLNLETMTWTKLVRSAIVTASNVNPHINFIGRRQDFKVRAVCSICT